MGTPMRWRRKRLVIPLIAALLSACAVWGGVRLYHASHVGKFAAVVPEGFTAAASRPGGSGAC